MHHFPWDAASPLKDRLLFAKETDSDDPDAGGGDGLSDELEHMDDTDLTTEHDDPEGSGGDPYKKRFADTKTDRDKWKKTAEEKDAEAESLRRENEALRSVNAQRHTRGADYGDEVGRQNPQELQLVDSIAEAVNREYTALPEEKRNVVGLTKIIASKMIPAQREMAIQIAGRIVEERKAADTGKVNLRAMADASLEAVGLNGKQHYPVMRGLIQDRVEKDPDWFQRTPVAKQFEILADDSKTYLQGLGVATKEAVRKANEEHRREAEGMLESGSRRATTRQADDDEPEKGSTMIDAMNANRKLLVHRAGRFAGTRR